MTNQPDTASADTERAEDGGFDYPPPSHIAPGEPGAPQKTPPRTNLEDYVTPIWSHQEAVGENDLWFSRFCHYASLGPDRSVSLAATGRRNAYPLPSHWMVQSKDFRWRERARALDAAVAAGEAKPMVSPLPTLA